MHLVNMSNQESLHAVLLQGMHLTICNASKSWYLALQILEFASWVYTINVILVIGAVMVCAIAAEKSPVMKAIWKCPPLVLISRSWQWARTQRHAAVSKILRSTSALGAYGSKSRWGIRLAAESPP